jgi:hypothetical protein
MRTNQSRNASVSDGSTKLERAPTRKKVFRCVGSAVIAAGLTSAVLVGATTAAQASSAFVPLTLINSWTAYGNGTNAPGVANIFGVVTLEGAISTTSSNTNAEPFVLPTNDRPVAAVYVPVDMCDATNGRLEIATTGAVTVEAESSFSDAQCFTSLDGVSFVTSTNLTPLTLINGWTNAPFSTNDAGVQSLAGVVSFQGAIATSGTNPEPFVLPAGMRPAAEVYVPIDLCNATNGRLQIAPSGTVTVEAETAFSDAQCFTSLDGASFVISGKTTALKLTHGWTGQPFSTGKPVVESVNGVIRFRGAMSTSGTNASPFRLPLAMRPSHTVYTKVDLCGANNGRLVITSAGNVTVQAESGTFSNAQCFTSLDGTTFAP